MAEHIENSNYQNVSTCSVRTDICGSLPKDTKGQDLPYSTGCDLDAFVSGTSSSPAWMM